MLDLGSIAGLFQLTLWDREGNKTDEIRGKRAALPWGKKKDPRQSLFTPKCSQIPTSIQIMYIDVYYCTLYLHVQRVSGWFLVIQNEFCDLKSLCYILHNLILRHSYLSAPPSHRTPTPHSQPIPQHLAALCAGDSFDPGTQLPAFGNVAAGQNTKAL